MQEKPESPSSLRSLFNGRAMLHKVGRDALVSGILFGTTLTAAAFTAAGDGNAWIHARDILPIGAQLTLYATALITLSRYAGGAIGLAGDTVYDRLKKNPPLTTQTGRKTAAGIAGVSAGIAAFFFVLGVLSFVRSEAHNVPEGKVPAQMQTFKAPLPSPSA